MSERGWRWLWQGDLPAAALAVTFSDRAPLLPPGLAAAMDAHWQQEMSRARAASVRLFDGAMAQLLGFAAGAAGLRLSLGRTSYRHWRFSAGRQAEIEARFGEGTASRPLALCAAVITADRRLLIQERSSAVAEGAGLLHMPGGHLDPDRHRRGDLGDRGRPSRGDPCRAQPQQCGGPSDGDPGVGTGLPDPYAAMLAELEEELGLTQSDLGGGRLLGFMESQPEGKPELLWRFDCRLESRILHARAAFARDGFEYRALQFIPCARVQLAPWIAQNEARLATPSRALLTRLSEAMP